MSLYNDRDGRQINLIPKHKISKDIDEEKQISLDIPCAENWVPPKKLEFVSTIDYTKT